MDGPEKGSPGAPQPPHSALPPCASAHAAQGQILGRRERVPQEPGPSAAGTRAGSPGGSCSAGIWQPYCWGSAFPPLPRHLCDISSSQSSTATARAQGPKQSCLHPQLSFTAGQTLQPAHLGPHSTPSSPTPALGSGAAPVPAHAPAFPRALAGAVLTARWQAQLPESTRSQCSRALTATPAR